MRVAKVVNSSLHSAGYRLFMSISKRILPDEPTRDVAMEAFDTLSGQKVICVLYQIFTFGFIIAKIL